MNPYGYAYGQSEPYFPQQYDTQPHHAYSFPGSSGPSNVGIGLQHSQKDYTQNGFSGGHNLIPGLGMSLSNGASEIHGGPLPTSYVQPTGPGSMTASVQLSNKQDASLETREVGQSTAPNEPTNESMEEGEVSEGELEDIYDPEALEENTHEAPKSSNLTPHTVETRQQGLPQDGEALERSGSYSPYLSPREITSTRPASPQGQQANQADLKTPTASFSSDSEAASIQAETTWDEARKHAQETILRLWPLKIRYQDYLNEGLDEATLRSLFTDLGLDMKLSPERDSHIANTQAMDSGLPTTINVEDSSRMQLESHETPKAPMANSPKEPKRSRGEERKDRIARLLAAKQASVPQPSEKPGVTPTAKPAEKPPSVAPAKTQAQIAEKSKLVQQKMEALRKAREAQAQAQAASRQQAAEVTQPILTQNSSATQAPAVEIVTSNHHQVQDGNTNTPSPIPGLFLPAGQTAPSSSQQKRPMASELNDLSDPTTKRPFGQPRQSQRFLIDISDDEDDAAMEIDSPELDPASFHTSGKFKSRFGTDPPRTTRSATGGGNLESMNKEIELMKRRIAEAEARRRAKLSRAESAHGQNGHADMNTESSESASKSGPVSSVDGSDLAREESPPAGPLEFVSQRLPKASDSNQNERRIALRQRSRVASERLPLVEAHRQEQLRKLETLRSQMEDIQKDIEASLEEEKQLRDEVTFCNTEVQNDNHKDTPVLVSAVKEPVAVEALDTPSRDSAQGPQPEGQVVAVETEQHSLADATQGGTPDDFDDHASIDDENNTEMPDIESHEDTDDNSDDRMDEATTSSEAEYQPEVQGQGLEAETSTEQEAQVNGQPHSPDAREHEDLELQTLMQESDKSPSFSPEPAENSSHETSDNDQQAILPTPLTKSISTGQVESTAASPREENHQEKLESRPGSSFVPYDSSLRPFRAYRFHPQFNNSVPGGFRSLTYSNKIDANLEVCPDQLAGQACSRGDMCPYQHFEAMQLADDQILLQLGSHSSFEGEQKAQFINGLRRLLTDYRERKIKDFQTISNGIVEYRANFSGDKSKILPLGNVSL
uniref:C3H1-type domain-containing protein n=1 Tax=Bionectria ochroleuca TaxID=29856 RepID=A0A8H7NJZ7_BIOOC